MSKCARKLGFLLLLIGIPIRAAAPEGQSVLEALPTSARLGKAWKLEISYLVDPLSTPPEIVHAKHPNPEAFLQRERNQIHDPTNSISGSGHAHYDFQSDTNSTHYEVQLSRYRNHERLESAFNELLAVTPTRSKIITDLGDAAVIHSNTNSMTVWFRRGDFMVHISPLPMTKTWETDPALRQLAKGIDSSIDPKRKP